MDEHLDALFQSVHEGRREPLLRYIHSHGNLEVKNHEGLPLLHAAIRGENPALPLMLIAAGAKPDVADSKGYRALHLAALSGNNMLLESLLSHDVDPNAKSLEGDTPLLMAILRGNVDAITILCSRGANVNDHIHHTTYLHLLASLPKIPNRLEVARALLIAGIPANTADHDGNTPLHILENDTGELATLFVDWGADANAPNSRGHTPLHSAAVRDDHAIVVTLIALGADPSATSRYGAMPIDYAHSDAVASALSSRASQGAANQTGGDGLT
jgi:ankyrin repeat protein